MTSIDNMAAEIASALKEYSEEVTEDIKQEVKKVAKETSQELASTSPAKGGGYGKGWKTKVSFENGEDIRVTVYNKSKWQLTHLLEHGHAVKNGTGRAFGKTRAFPHIAEAEANAEKKLMDKAKVVVRG